MQLTAESLSTPTIAPEPISTEWVQSTARSAQVELVTIRPAGVIGKLPVCLALHGRSANAKTFLDLGVPDALNLATSTTGTRPFAVVSVDGGDSYWVARQPSDDPQKMLLQDLPIWLSNRGFEPIPFAAMGISMGGYGALNYARNPGLAAVAAISSALFDNWTEARKRNAFASEAAWEATEPLRHIDELGAATQLGVWCGTSDPFIAQSRRLVERAHPRISAITAGDHTEPYWRRILPEVLRFIGAAAPAV
ncbi:MAG TPA: alpha/beta hydrolase-fold protein [Actinophytocola sp.]|uniref:alpha/beta hydrolase n=1 Tax=Actinophytocola sp. TaxID=1872138 RepID=UPI002DB67764|nr:alpha/beta hydrolase-fold protein [Actinophytocola sp.]HEU5475018.1 alpha/beta hydrolase-fold protein [Actinophytocola sp.]